MVVGSALTVSFLVYRRGLHVRSFLEVTLDVPSYYCSQVCVENFPTSCQAPRTFSNRLELNELVKSKPHAQSNELHRGRETTPLSGVRFCSSGPCIVFRTPEKGEGPNCEDCGGSGGASQPRRCAGGRPWPIQQCQWKRGSYELAPGRSPRWFRWWVGFLNLGSVCMTVGCVVRCAHHNVSTALTTYVEVGARTEFCLELRSSCSFEMPGK